MNAEQQLNTREFLFLKIFDFSKTQVVLFLLAMVTFATLAGYFRYQYFKVKTQLNALEAEQTVEPDYQEHLLEVNVRLAGLSFDLIHRYKLDSMVDVDEDEAYSKLILQHNWGDAREEVLAYQFKDFTPCLLDQVFIQPRDYQRESIKMIFIEQCGDSRKIHLLTLNYKLKSGKYSNRIELTDSSEEIIDLGDVYGSKWHNIIAWAENDNLIVKETITHTSGAGPNTTHTQEINYWLINVNDLDDRVLLYKEK